MAAKDSMKQKTHRPSLWKQQNKSHKHGKHRSKGELDRENKGRVCVKTLSKKQRKEMQKLDKRNRAQQLRKNKREEVMLNKRGLGGADSAPILTVIIPLHEDVKVSKLVEMLSQCDEESTLTHTANKEYSGGVHISIPRFRQRFCFVSATHGNLYGILDAIKVADTALFMLDPEHGMDESGELALSACLAHGLPTSTFGSLANLDMHIKKKSEHKKHLEKEIEKYGSDQKLVWIEKTQDMFLLLRQIGSQKQRRVQYRETRPHLFADSYEYVPYPDQPNSGKLLVKGYVRGACSLSVYHLVHIPGVGDFQLSQIDKCPDPHPLKLKNSNSREAEEITMLMRANPNKLESLQAENEIDPMEGEQTWPTEEELQEAEDNLKKAEKKKVPKGTSEYQAAWIFNSDDEEDDGDSDSEGDDDEMEMEAESQDGSDNDEEDGEEEDDEEELPSEGGSRVTFATEDERYDDKMDMDEEAASLKKLKEAREDEMFPDEIDTPIEIPARERFQKFRGLSSFRTSPWDPKENLPVDYQRIFTFQNFKGCRKQVMKEAESRDGAMPGWFVRVHVVIDKGEDFLNALQPGHPLVLFGMLKHEQRMSVLNIVLKRSRGHTVQPSTVENKETMIFHVGFRRFSARPIFSQHTNGDKHKLERYFRPGSTVVATVYAPITFTPAPVLAFKPRTDYLSHEFIGSGSLLSVDPYRIILKRAVLSGNPLKIHKRTAVIRYMFFNREDITYFKPVELRSKCGRRGHITQPMGTHGHMKCTFDGQLASQDTVLLTLYKRVFPKWSYEIDRRFTNAHYTDQESMDE